MVNEVEFGLVIDDKGVKRSFDGVAKQAKETGNAIGDSFGGGLKDAMGSLKSLALAGLGVAAVFEGLHKAMDLIKMAEEIKTVHNQFEVLSERAGVSGLILEDALKKSAAGLVTTHELLQASNRAIIEFEGSASKLPQVLELARKSTAVFGGDVTQNFEALNHAIAAQNQRGLKNLGIIIDVNKAQRDYAKSIGTTAEYLTQEGKQQAILNAVLEKGQTAFEGVNASAKVNTLELKRVSVALHEMEEAGAVAFDKVFGGIVQNALKSTSGALHGIADDLKLTFGSESEKAEVKVRHLTGEINAMKTALAQATEQQDKHGMALTQWRIDKARGELEKFDAASEKAFMRAVKNQSNLEKSSEDKPNNSIDLEKLKKERLAFNEELSKANKARIEDESKVNTSFEEVVALSEERKAQIEEEFNIRRQEAKRKFLDTGVVDKARFNELELQLEADKNAKLLDLQNQANANSMSVGQAWSTTMTGMGDAAGAFALKAAVNFKQIGATMFQSLGTAAGNAFAAFGKAVAKGENAVGAFLNSLIASMGAMAIQLGSMFILQGIAYLWAGMPNGPSLIAAGAALAAIGGVLSAVGGGGGGASTDSSAGGGLAADVKPDDASATKLQDPERLAPGTVVNLNVHGNVLDRRQTGLELADVLRENFDTNAVSIGGVA